MTLHAGLANSTSLQSSELCESNSKKKEKKKRCLWENRHFLFNPFPMHEFTCQWCNCHALGNHVLLWKCNNTSAK